MSFVEFSANSFEDGLKYALLSPGTFAELDGFCYVSFSQFDNSSAVILCSLVRSGLWACHSEVAEDVSIANLMIAGVSSGEALSGVATYVGQHVLIPSRSKHGRTWSYFLVCGSMFGNNSASWFLVCADLDGVDRQSLDCVELLMPNVASIVLVDPINLCSQPELGKNLMGRPVSLAQSASEMVSRAFLDFERTAKRDSTTMENFVSSCGIAVKIQESARVPIFNFNSSLVVWQLVHDVLDFEFYTVGQRNPPTNQLVRLGSLSTSLPAIATGAVTGTGTGTVTGSSRSNISKRVVLKVPARKRKQTELESSLAEDFLSGEDEVIVPESDDDDTLHDAVDSDFVEDEEPIVKRRKNSLSSQQLNNSDPLANERAQFRRIVDAISDPDKDGSRGFKTTTTQAMVFQNVSNGKCASGIIYSSPQQWVESLQSLDFGLVWYPSFCCGLSSFEFSRTISIASFAFEDWLTAGLRGNTFDMADFSRKAKKSVPPILKSLAQVSACVGQLYRLSLLIFKPRLSKALDRLRQFLVEQEVTESDLGPDPVAAMVVWVDNRLYALRTAFAANSKRLLDQVVASFDTVAKEYRRVIQICEAQKWRARETVHGSNSFSNKFEAGKEKGARNRDSNKHFGTVLRGIPKRDNTPVCFNNLSAKGCKTKDCKRSHDLVAAESIAGDVVTAFTALYGPLRADLP